MPTPIRSWRWRASPRRTALSGRYREGDGQDRRRVDGQEPRPHPRRMDQALRRKVGPEGQVSYLEVRNLTKRFGDFTALRDVSLDVGEGEFVCFLGPSGCGKTTLLRAIAGLDPQSSGTIRQKGRDMSALPP